MSVELAAFSGDRHGMLRKVQTSCLVLCSRFQHSVPSLLCSTRLRDDDRQSGGDVRTQPLEYSINSVRIGIVQIMNSHPIGVSAKCVGYKLRTESGAANANQ